MAGVESTVELRIAGRCSFRVNSDLSPLYFPILLPFILLHRLFLVVFVDLARVSLGGCSQLGAASFIPKRTEATIQLDIRHANGHYDRRNAYDGCDNDQDKHGVGAGNASARGSSQGLWAQTYYACMAPILIGSVASSVAT